MKAYRLFFVGVLTGMLFFTSHTAYGTDNLTALRRSKMDYYDLQDWLTSKRSMASSEIEKDLLDWPENRWASHCSGILDYFGRLGQQFTTLCGDVIRTDAEKLWNCAPALSTPSEVLNSAQKCWNQGNTLVEKWGTRISFVENLTKCTVKSYVTAADMTTQQREDWITFIDGLDDLKALFSLSEVFEHEQLAELLGEVSVPKIGDDPAETMKNIEKVAANLKGRADDLQNIPNQMGSVKKAIITIQPFRNSFLLSKMKEAETALSECRVGVARDQYTMAKLQANRQIGSQRAAVVLAEDRFYCAAININFHKLDFQAEVLNGSYRGMLSEHNDLVRANRAQRDGLRLYEKMINNTRLSEAAFQKMQTQYAIEKAKVNRLLAVSDACVESCGVRDQSGSGSSVPVSTMGLPPGIAQAVNAALGLEKCTTTLHALQEGLRSSGQSVCSEEVRKDLSAELEQRVRDLDKVLTARNRAKEIIRQFREKVTSITVTCDFSQGDLEAARNELEKRITEDEEAYGVSNKNCYDGVDSIEKLIADRIAACQKAQGNGEDGADVVSSEDVEIPEESIGDIAYFKVLVEGSGYSATYGDGTHKINGSDERYLIVNRGEHVRERLEEMRKYIEGDPCERTWPIMVGEEVGAPNLFISGPKLTIIDGPYFSYSEFFDSLELAGNWRLNGKDGPHPVKLKEMVCQ